MRMLKEVRVSKTPCWKIIAHSQPRFILTGLAVCAGLESLGVFHHSHNAFAGMVFGAIVRDHVLLRHSVSRHQLCPLDI